MPYLVTGSTAMHYEVASTGAEIGYTLQVTLAEGICHYINALRQKHGLPGV